MSPAKQVPFLLSVLECDVTAPTNIVASVLARLRNVAAESELSFSDVLQAYDRTIFGPAHAIARSNTVLLKGALMLRVWGVPRARPTMDIDLLRRGIAEQTVLVRFASADERCLPWRLLP